MGPMRGRDRSSLPAGTTGSFSGFAYGSDMPFGGQRPTRPRPCFFVTSVPTTVALSSPMEPMCTFRPGVGALYPPVFASMPYFPSVSQGWKCAPVTVCYYNESCLTGFSYGGPVGYCLLFTLLIASERRSGSFCPWWLFGGEKREWRGLYLPILFGEGGVLFLLLEDQGVWGWRVCVAFISRGQLGLT